MAKSHPSLGSQLKQSRELMALTLRQVEEVTGISNAYLSQLENDKIKSPSANILYKLSNIYNINLNSLFLSGRAIEEHEKKDYSIKHLNAKNFLTQKITPDEEQVLLEYLRFIRYKKKRTK